MSILPLVCLSVRFFHYIIDIRNADGVGNADIFVYLSVFAFVSVALSCVLVSVGARQSNDDRAKKRRKNKNRKVSSGGGGVVRRGNV